MKSISKGIALIGIFFAFGTALAYAEAPVEKEWTFLVYLNGHNNLDSFGTADMKEMEQVGSNDKMNVIVLRDTASTAKSTKMYYVEKGSSRVIKDYGQNIDMGDWRNLVEFFKFAKANYPAKRFAVDIWNHGSGWSKKAAAEPVRGISYDDGSGNHITTPQLKIAFKAMQDANGGQKIDLFGMDACLMQMAEVIYEVAESVDVVVGSEQTEPGDGWAYQLFLALLANKPGMDAEELGMLIEREYAASYNGGVQGRQSVQGSAVSATRLLLAREHIDNLLSYMIAIAPQYQRVMATALAASQHFYYAEYKDLIHFIKLAKEKIDDPTFQALADTALSAIGDSVIANYVTGTGLGNSFGISVWGPTQKQYTSKKLSYRDLAWTKETRWEEFLENTLFPIAPVLSLAEITPMQEDQDGFISAGERVGFRVDIKNESPIAGQDARLSVVPAEGFFAEVGTISIGVIEEGAKSVEGLITAIGSNVPAGTYTFKFILEVAGLPPIVREAPVTVDANYTIEGYNLSSAHNYVNGATVEWVISKPGVAGMRVHFAKFATEPKYDYVLILDKNGNVISKLDNKKGAFWAPLVPGDTMKIRLVADSSVNDYGFDIDKLAY
ncbi:MAG: hypothetical protein A2428_10470 [Bdellovibrionales bacterium RIFOXYC1_FULL_54_43]|nr:MAG: hypothetical protein A2428_10470 [Bdellovibrionales bacterium RIFOXYC1_FULL_54_43]OFZ80409.1 MAG: hypothetical protein A2603_13595 [Bdellovibrionales bacterium RIFOXYD1_FULL_55_31]